MSLPIHRLTKKEIVWLAKHKCKAHRHDFLSHYNCFLLENPEQTKEHIGFLDIESGGSLTADFGYTLTYCIKTLDGEIIKNKIKPSEIRSKIKDKRLVSDFCRDIKNFDVIVVYYGRDGHWRHDLPFLRTRCTKWDIDFMLPKSVKVIDVYDIIKSKFKLAHNRMQSACELFNIPSKGHKLNPEVWQDALAGKQKAIDYILTHNIEDVVSLENLYKKVVRYKPNATDI